MKYDYKQNVGNMLMYLLYKVHIHLDYDIDVDDHIVHCMVMENNRYARNKKNKNHFIIEIPNDFLFKEVFLSKECVCINLYLSIK